MLLIWQSPIYELHGSVLAVFCLLAPLKPKKGVEMWWDADGEGVAPSIGGGEEDGAATGEGEPIHAAERSKRRGFLEGQENSPCPDRPSQTAQI